MPKTVTRRVLNRTLLARQFLLERTDLPMEKVIEGMGGIQNQYAPAAYIGLWSRVRDFDRSMLTAALEERRVVQGTMMRGTIHLVTAADYWPMMAGIRRINREWFTKQVRAMAGTDMTAVARAVEELLADGPMRMKDLGDRLAAHGFPPRSAAWAGWWVDLLRVPPSGTWERRRADLYARADRWLRPVAITEPDGMELLIRRYLGAYGPAPLGDIATWMGVNVGQMRPIAERMELRSMRDEDGRQLVDLADAPLADADAPAPARFVAVWDAMLLVHARRTGVLPEEYRPHLFSTRVPHSFNTFLLDGAVAGAWRVDGGEVRLTPFRRLSKAERAELDDEASRLAAFHL